MLKELSSFSSVRFNNFLFSILFIMSAGLESRQPKEAFWSTLFFQIVLLAPLFVTFSVDTQHRLPPQRVAVWPLSRTRRIVLSSISFVLNPLFIVLFFGYLFWMGLVAGLVFVLLAFIVHVTVYAVGRLPFELRTPAQHLKDTSEARWNRARDVAGAAGNLDFWTALLIAVSGTFMDCSGGRRSLKHFRCCRYSWVSQ
jgi:hypothetical protein